MENEMKTALRKGWDAYHSNNPDWNEYMETDYSHGFEDGWRASVRRDALRKKAAIAAMQSLILKGDTSPECRAKLAVRHADALINELKETKQ